MKTKDSTHKVLSVHSGIANWFRGDVKELNKHLADGWKVVRVDSCNQAILYLLVKKKCNRLNSMI